ncbi:Multicopper oxidase, types 2 and 3 [Marinomonas sp. MED121]|uniref:multicopper oxidase family protein n=1 Tax=Marinomonas sp. MED121 TaxID=314277 RepID=UPI000068FEFA|nr:multicopper oxidase family protein [Marinomonas sp. MED121]EAQ66955.1 Multicopper oxidase, types 2 and 3 [Marinomonas sp. MED121]
MSKIKQDKYPRRSFIKGVGLTGLTGVLGAGTGYFLSATPSAWAQNTHSRPLQNPPQEVAVDGLLRVNINAQYGNFELMDQQTYLRCFDNQPIGRTLRVKAGDTIRLGLHNKLPYDPLQEICTSVPTLEDNTPRGFNVTNMHVHGVHVSPKSPADNIFTLVRFQESEHYIYNIPKDHPPGTYFYHAHFHGSVALQVASGMAGALIIEGEIDEVAEIKACKEQVLCFQTPRFDKEGLCENYDLLSEPGAILINGQYKPVITMKQGEVQRWRMVNASHMANMQFNLQGHQVTAICFDGNPLKTSRVQNQIVMVPGNRADILVKASKAGTYAIYSETVTPEDSDTDIEAKRLGSLVVESQVLDMPLFSGELPRPNSLNKIEHDEVTFGRRLEFGLSGAAEGNKYTINGEPFSCLNPWQIPLGAVEEWEVYNHTAESHPFHIHVNPFQMISGGDVEPGTWLDTVNLAPFSRIRFRTRFTDFTGTFVFHCHNLTHEDLGMMQAIEVVQR